MEKSVACRETSYHFVKNFFPSRTVSDDPEGRTYETWETLPPGDGPMHRTR